MNTDADGVDEIFEMAPDGSDVTQRTFGRRDALEPAWSPDGDRIVFSGVSVDGGREIFILEPSGSTSQLTELRSGEEGWQPTWSPDGSTIAFVIADPHTVTTAGTCHARSGSVNVDLARETMPKFSAHFEQRDIVVTEFSFAPGGVSGWHSHPGKVLVGVARGSITLYRGNDPDCAGTTYHTGDIWIEHPGVVHESRNEDTVGAVVNSTFLGVPVGQSPRIDEAKPANCD